MAKANSKWLVATIHQEINGRIIKFQKTAFDHQGDINTALNDLTNTLHRSMGDGETWQERKIAHPEKDQDWKKGFLLWNGEAKLHIGSWVDISCELYCELDGIL